MSRWDPDPDEVRDVRPYDFASAKRAIARASRDQRGGEDAIKTTRRALGEAERAYRKALAVKITEIRAEGGASAVAADLARGDGHVADLRYARDVADGVYEAAKQAGWRHSADRRELEQLIDWSRGVAPNGQEREPEVLERPVGAAA